MWNYQSTETFVVSESIYVQYYNICSYQLKILKKIVEMFATLL